MRVAGERGRPLDEAGGSDVVVVPRAILLKVPGLCIVCAYVVLQGSCLHV